MKEYKEIVINETDSNEIKRRIDELEAAGWVNTGGEPVEKIYVKIVGVRRYFEREIKNTEQETKSEAAK